VFPWFGNRYGFPAVVTGMTKLASQPGGIAQGGLRVTADGETKLKLDWDAPASDGGSSVTHYLIQVDSDRDNDTNRDGSAFASWCDVAVRKASDARMYTYDGKIASIDKGTDVCSADPAAAPLTPTGESLKGGYARWFRVIALNKKSNTSPATVANGWVIAASPDGLPTLGAGMLYQASIDTALPARGVTGSSMAPGAPIGLVAETAKNVHSLLTTQKGVLLTWAKPGSGTPTSYVIQRGIDGGAWETVKDDVSPASTDFTDQKKPTATEQFVYRVAAKNQFGTSVWSNMAYFSGTDDLTMAGHTHTPVVVELTAPTGADASVFAGNSIIVSWDPDTAQNADLIVVALFNEGVTALADIPNNVHPINLNAMEDPGTHSFNNVPSGTYKVVVASESDGVYQVSLVAEVVTVP
jgi:hypothetical protein